MKFDQTFISIRQRNVTELFDLALTIVRSHWRGLLYLLIVGALPWVILDCFLLWPLMLTSFDDPARWGFSWLASLLVVSQAQYGTSLLTQYLGQAMFVGQPDVHQLARNALRVSPYFAWLHGFIRVVFPVTLAVWCIDFEEQVSFGMLAGMLIPMLVVSGLIVRALRPFASEMLLLEKTPRKSDSESIVTFSKRSASLHQHAGSELFGRFFVTCLFAIPLAIALQSMFVWFDSLLNLAAGSDWTLSSFYWMVSLWLTAGFVAVVRFLSYIDIRIRQEGWAVELRMRAEGQKLGGAIANS